MPGPLEEKAFRLYKDGLDDAAYALMRESGEKLPLFRERTLSLVLDVIPGERKEALTREVARVSRYIAALHETDCSARQRVWRDLYIEQQEVLLRRLNDALDTEAEMDQSAGVPQLRTDARHPDASSNSRPVPAA